MRWQTDHFTSYCRHIAYATSTVKCEWRSGRWNRETWQRGTRSEVEQKSPFNSEHRQRGQAAAKSKFMQYSYILLMHCVILLTFS